jgi:D-3-phosphoglycerate dehydrogenase
VCCDKVCPISPSIHPSQGDANEYAVNNILLNHNIDKQMSDSRGEVAYLMADLSNIKEDEIKDLFQSLQELSSCIRTRVLYG